MARALEKLPADRFESAKAFHDALGSEGYSYATAAVGLTAATPAGAATGWFGGRRATLAAWTLAAVAVVAATQANASLASVVGAGKAPVARHLILQNWFGELRRLTAALAAAMRHVHNSVTVNYVADANEAEFKALLPIGDSRHDVWRDGTLMQMTRDQTMAQDLMDEGALTKDVAARTPRAHVLSSALGGGTDHVTVVVTRSLPRDASSAA